MINNEALITEIVWDNTDEKFENIYLESISLIDLKDFIDKQLEKVPEQYKNDVEFDIDCICHDEYSCNTYISISYLRQKTKEDIEKETKEENERSALVKQAELENYYRIKNKYNL